MYNNGVICAVILFDTKVALRRKERGRSNSVSSSVGYGGPDPQRESELTVAMNNLTLDDIEGNVFRMSRDQVCAPFLSCRSMPSFSIHFVI